MLKALEKVGAVHRSREQWTAMVKDWRQSRLSIATFCEHAGIKPKTFGWWRWAIEGNHAHRSKPSRPGRRRADRASTPGNDEVGRSKSAVSFVELISPAVVQEQSVASSQLDRSGHSAGVEVVVGRGRVVRVSPGFHPETLRRVLSVLEEEKPC